MLDAVPDLRPALNAASDEEHVEIFRAFDLTITYDKHEQRLHLAATITPELLPVLCPNDRDRPEGRSQINDIAGAGLIHKPATVHARRMLITYEIEESRALPQRFAH